MTKPNQLTETNKLYDYYNSYEHRVERVKDIMILLKDTESYDDFLDTLNMYLKDLKKELHGKKYKNTMWYCHD
jgi:flagellar biosynthesis chaperone FliJ